MVESEEVGDLLPRIAEGNDEAVEALWNRYFESLVRVAGRKLEGMAQRAVSDEDVALSALMSFVDGIRRHKFDGLRNQNELWKLLVTITARKATGYRRKAFAEKRGGGRVRGESVFVGTKPEAEREAGIGQVIGTCPTPEMANMVVENCREMLGLLEPKSRQIALWTLEGYAPAEIAERLDCARRTVERKLERIRRTWSRLGLGPSGDRREEKRQSPQDPPS